MRVVTVAIAALALAACTKPEEPPQECRQISTGWTGMKDRNQSNGWWTFVVGKDGYTRIFKNDNGGWRDWECRVR